MMSDASRRGHQSYSRRRRARWTPRSGNSGGADGQNGRLVGSCRGGAADWHRSLTDVVSPRRNERRPRVEAEPTR